MHNYKAFADFNEGLQEIKSIIPAISKYIGDSEKYTPEGVVNEMMKEIKNNFPSIFNPEYPTTSALSITATEVGFKTPGFYSFGWRVEQGENGTVKYSFRVSFWYNKSYSNANEVKFAEHGWKQVSVNRQHSEVKKNSKRAAVKVQTQTQTINTVDPAEAQKKD